MADLDIKKLVEQLFKKHNFVFTLRKALWIAPTQEGIGTLVITCGTGGQTYVVARTYLHNGKEVTGFRVYYNHNWIPIAAVNDLGGLIRDPDLANLSMCRLIQTFYLNSEKAMIRVEEYP